MDEAGKEHDFSFDKWIGMICARFDLEKFFGSSSMFLLEAYTYTLAMFPERFKTAEQMHIATSNLHKMVPLDTPLEDAPEEDLRFVYAVRDYETDSYRWGVCVSSQSISYVVADEKMNLDAELNVQGEDGLPLVMFALYEKYTCLRFTQRMAELKQNNTQILTGLKDMMLRFRAFGTITAANISRWYNVRQIYDYLVNVFDLPSAIEDVVGKVNILTDHQEKIAQNRFATVINIITVFGIVTILASVLSIVQILSDGGSVFWVSTFVTMIALFVFKLIAVRHS